MTTESTRKSTINKGTDTNKAIEGRHEVIYKANRKETIIMNSTKYDSPSQLSQLTTYKGELCDYHDTVQLTFHFYSSFCVTHLLRWINFACILYTPALSLQKLRPMISI